MTTQTEVQEARKDTNAMEIADLVARCIECVDRYDYAQALELGQQILTLDHRHETGIHVVGLCYLRLGDAEKARPLLEQTLNAKPSNGRVFWQYAEVLSVLQQYDRAITYFDRADELGVVDELLDEQRYDAAGQVFKRHCHWVDYDRIQRLVRQSVLSSGRWIIGESTLASPRFTNAVLLKATQHHAKHILASTGEQESFEYTPPRQRIRLGFVGCDFFEQATAYLMVGFIEAIDRDQFELFAYDHDDVDRAATQFRQRVIAAYDHFIPIKDLSDQAAAKRIHSDKIDVLFSIKNPASARLGIFARRPAAIQIHYLYYPGTSGMPFFDYIVGDDVVTPLGAEHFYTEKILRLKGCYQPNDASRLQAEDTSLEEWGLPKDAIVMANFNQTYKYTPDMFDLWCQLMSRDERRVLWILAESAAIKSRLIREAQARGVKAERLYFAEKVTTQPYLNRLRRSDLILDTFPYGGHTLGSDALWSGTPIITLCGETYASRVAASLLHNVGMSELVAFSEQEYLEKADALLRDPQQRRYWRQHLDQGRAGFTLFDSKDYARRFERAVHSVISECWEG